MKTNLLLVEGVPGAGKTTLINRLVSNIASQPSKTETIISLGQKQTYFPVVNEENKFYASRGENLRHLDKVFDFLFWAIHPTARNTLGKTSIVLDTLHFTHYFRPGTITQDDLQRTDDKLLKINGKLLLLKTTADNLWERLIVARSKADSGFLERYQSKYGSTLQSLHRYYLEEQNRMETLISKSKLEKLIVTSDRPVSIIAGIVFNFWQA
jgi:thymidylate kinase